MSLKDAVELAMSYDSPCGECAELRAQAMFLVGALHEIRSLTNGQLTETWTRDAILARCDVALARLPAQALAERAEIEGSRNAWKEEAARCQRNTDYYRGLVQQIGELLGAGAYLADDGSRSEDVLCAKVPELVAAQRAQVEGLAGALHRLCLAAEHWADVPRGENQEAAMVAANDGRATLARLPDQALAERRALEACGAELRRIRDATAYLHVHAAVNDEPRPRCSMCEVVAALDAARPEGEHHG